MLVPINAAAAAISPLASWDWISARPTEVYPSLAWECRHLSSGLHALTHVPIQFRLRIRSSPLQPPPTSRSSWFTCGGEAQGCWIRPPPVGDEVWEGKYHCRALLFPPEVCPQGQDGFSTQGLCVMHVHLLAAFWIPYQVTEMSLALGSMQSETDVLLCTSEEINQSGGFCTLLGLSLILLGKILGWPKSSLGFK